MSIDKPKFPDHIQENSIYYIELQELLLSILTFIRQQIDFNNEVLDKMTDFKRILEIKAKEYDILMMDLEQRIWEMENIENGFDPYFSKNLQ